MKNIIKTAVLCALTLLSFRAHGQSPKEVELDTRVAQYITPTRVVWKANEQNISNLDAIFTNSTGQADLHNASVAHISSRKDNPTSFLVDFGKEINGAIQLVTGMSNPNRPIKIRVRFGESVSEAMCEITPENGATNDHALRDFEMSLPWLGVAKSHDSGFRFARIDIIDDVDGLQLKELRAVARFRNIPYLGSFESSDQRLNQIWQTGAYTVHINMQDYLWDGVKRDRLVWVGDLHPEVMTVSSVFGYNEVVPKSLDFIRDITPLPRWMNDISSYSIWWLLIHHDWYLYQGDLDYLREQKDYMLALLEHLLTKIDSSGKEMLDGARFLDWPSSENPEAIGAGLQSLMLEAMEKGAKLARILEDDSLGGRCEGVVRLMRENAQELTAEFTESSRKAPVNGSKQGAALLSLAGLMNPQKANDEYLAVDGAHGFSTFYGYYMLEAMAKAGNYQGAMDVISEYWGAMLDLGATTFWEDFNIDWLENAGRIDELVPDGKIDIHSSYGGYCYRGFRHSFAHGWASGPTSWLTRHVLGVEVLEPGARVVRIKPNLGELQWVKGTFPTPQGVISISHIRGKDGSIKTKIDAPRGIKIVR